jgi:hypothetical protein
MAPVMPYTLWNEDTSCSLLTNETGKVIYDLVDGKRTFTEILDRLLRSEGHSDIGKGGNAQLDDVLEITTIFFDLSRVLFQLWLAGHLYLKIPDKNEDLEGPGKPQYKRELLSPFCNELLKRLSDNESSAKQQDIFQEEFYKDKERSFQMVFNGIRNLIETDSLIPIHAGKI